jgi:hypothetical protein
MVHGGAQDMQRVVIVVVVALVAVGGLWMVVREDPRSESDEWEEVEEVDDEAPAAQRSRRSSSRSSGDAGLERRVAKLERQVTFLQKQLGMRAAATADGRDFDGEDFGAEMTDEPAFAEGVRQVLEEEKEKEQERWVEARRERWEEMSNEILDELVEEAGISTEHREVLFQAWTTEAEQILPLVMKARSGDSGWRETRDQIDEIRDETDATAKELLSEDQYAAYLDARPRPGRRGGPGGRGGRGGPPPGPPPP